MSRSFAREKSGQTPLLGQSPAPSSTRTCLAIVESRPGPHSSGSALKMSSVRAISASTKKSAPMTSYRASAVTVTSCQRFPQWLSFPTAFRKS